jgi:hypothetical protein
MQEALQDARTQPQLPIDEKARRPARTWQGEGQLRFGDGAALEG